MNEEPKVLYPAGLDYSVSVEQIAAELQSQSLVPLLGAGISLPPPASLPDANQLTKPLLGIIEAAVEQPLAQIARRKVLLNQVRSSRLERVLDAFHRVYGEVALDWLAQLESRNCNDNHLALAALVRAGVLPHIITLNFDRLIEEAIALTKVRCVTRCTLHPGSFATGEGPIRCIVTKPHGSIFPQSDKRFRYLGATLTQVGAHVSIRTLRALADIFREHPTLFVAGYSDHDWDIMPALMDSTVGVRRVIWVQHASAPPERALAWMRRLDSVCCRGNAIAIQGNVTRLLQDSIAALGAKAPPKPICHHSPITREVSQLFTVPVKNALVFSYLLHDDELKQQLLESLAPLSDVRDEVLQLSALASVAHTQRQVGKALRLNRQAYRRATLAGNTDADELAGRIIWMGYEHYCLCKRLHWRLVLAPWHLWRGWVLLRRGVRAGSDDTRVRRLALAEFYRADLIHSWANAMIRCGPWVVLRFRGIFLRLARCYRRVDQLDPELMAGEYYWLRQLEAQLLANEPSDVAKTRAKLYEILESYEQTQNSVQKGNPHVFLALLEYLYGAGVEMAAKHLDQAEDIWRRDGNVTPAGLYRVAVYRRFCGIKKRLPSALA